MKRYAPIPVDAIDDARLSRSMLVCLAVIARYRDGTTGVTHVAHATIAAKARVARRTVQRCIAGLVAAGYLEASGRFRQSGGRDANTYRIVYALQRPSAWRDNAKAPPLGRRPARAENRGQGDLPLGTLRHLDDAAAMRHMNGASSEITMRHLGDAGGRATRADVGHASELQNGCAIPDGAVSRPPSNEPLSSEAPSTISAPAAASPSVTASGNAAAPTNGHKHPALAPSFREGELVAIAITEACGDDPAKVSEAWEWANSQDTRLRKQGEPPATVDRLVARGVRKRFKAAAA